MKYIFQLAIIFGISFLGELLNALLPLPIPASVYGLAILFLLLCTKIVKLEQVETISEYLMAIMPLFFIEPTVGIINSYGLVKGNIAALFIASFLSFVAVVAVTGLVSQSIIKYGNKRKLGMDCEYSHIKEVKNKKEIPDTDIQDKKDMTGMDISDKKGEN